MKNKGFTLIELLAVIVILAIIALIATPIVLNIINDTRESSNERSMELYARAVQNAVAHYMMLHPGDTEVTFDDIKEYIKYDGAKVECENPAVKEDGSIVLDNCTVNGNEGYSYGVSDTDGVCTLTYELENGIITIDASVGTEVVTCGSEQFYVMERNDSTITMLAKYNLSTSASPYLQSSTNVGTTLFYGLTGVAPNGEATSEVLPPSNLYVYDNPEYPNLISPYVNTYKDYLVSSLGVNVLSAKLMSKEQAEALANWSGCFSGKEWACSTEYWLGTSSTMELCKDNGSCVEDGIVAFSEMYAFYNHDGGVTLHTRGLSNEYGIRPVITISTDQVQM